MDNQETGVGYMSRSVYWLTVKSPKGKGVYPPGGLLLVSSVGCHLFARSAHRAAEKNFKRTWRHLYRVGFRVVPILIREATK